MKDDSNNLPRYTLDPRPPRFGPPPFWLVSGGLIAVVASWLLLSLIARARASDTDKPRVQFMQDMGMQPRYSQQQSSEVFADGRADRPRIEGTVARGQLQEDDHYYRGYARGPVVAATTRPDVKFFDGYPSNIKVDEAFLRRGQERFNIYCSVCHGLDGYGHGAVNERAMELQNNGQGTTWTQAADLTKDPARTRPEGHIYNTINVGIRGMPAYGAQIPPEDRWAIVAYVKALQLSQDVRKDLVSQEIRDAGK